ncbi:MAG: hypothetical protein K9G42_11855 [Pedobacter sp.]|nr:hypothetical protein [Pedobacter sp.]
MKKVILFFAVAAVFAACAPKTEAPAEEVVAPEVVEEVVVDSAVVADTTAVVAE